MGQMSVQYTPVQVLQAARRAEAEGKMDYALQFYRHIVEQHGMSAEAQEARDGLYRIAEWRWGEARLARRPEVANGHGAHNVYHGVGSSAHADYPQEPPAHLPQIIAREAAAKAARQETPPPFKARFRAARLVAVLVSGLGWASVLAGLAVAVLAGAGMAAEASTAGLLGLPLGVLLGMPAAMIGFVLVIAGHLAVAVFESTNATLELLAIERGRLSF